MLDYDDFDFQEFCEEEREIEQQRQRELQSQSRPNHNYPPTGQRQSSQDNDTNAGIIVGVILAIVLVVLMIAFSDFLGPILIVGVGAYLLAKWILG